MPSPAPVGQALAEEDIRLRAYLKWQAAGRPEGNDVFFWVEAERELQRESDTAQHSVSVARQQHSR